MTNEELIEYFLKEKEKGNQFIKIDEEVFNEITFEQAEFLAENFHANTLIYLPEYEVRFFEWLKKTDYPIWKDLWADQELEPYIVGAALLPFLMLKDRGYPICDLLNNDNFFFSEKNIIEKNAKLLIESLKEVLLNKGKLSVAHLLLLEMSFAPLDIWHFAHHYSIQLDFVKRAVLELLQDNLIEHWTRADEIAELID
jgi:hypothetical protein